MRLRRKDKEMDEREKRKYKIFLVLSLVLAGVFYYIAYWVGGQNVVDFLAKITRHYYRLNLQDYVSLLCFGACGSLIGIAGTIVDALLRAGYVRFGLGCLVVIPLVIILSLPAALLYTILALLSHHHTPLWFR